MEEEYDFSEGERGPAFPPPPGTVRITLRIDEEALEWFRDQVDQAGGGNYQELINAVLRDYVQSRREAET